MGPNSRRSRKKYVCYRLSILKDMQIPVPSQEVIDKLTDEEQVSDSQLDAIFRKVSCSADCDFDWNSV